MGNSINGGNQYRTKITKGNIKANVLVTVTHPQDWSTKCTVKDSDGNEELYFIDELVSFGYLKWNSGCFDIVEEFNRDNIRYLTGHTHITKNVRGSLDQFRFYEDCLYSSDLGAGFDYVIRDLTDDEVIDIILNELIYDARPDLDAMSMVGTTAKGLDKEPNYRDGNYLLPNNKDYTVTWCYGKILIREGRDGGWYKGSKEVGRQIYEGQMDWERYKKAVIKKEAIRKLRFPKYICEEMPDVIELIINKIKDQDKFKLSKEFK